MEFISSKNAPAAVGPYSQAVKAGNMIFFSGQIPLDPVSMQIVDGGIVEQTKQVLKNIDAMLEAAGISKNMVAKATVFLQDMNDFGTFNPIYEEFFAGHKPARSTIQVAGLPKGALIEIEVIAINN